MTDEYTNLSLGGEISMVARYKNIRVEWLSSWVGRW